MEEDYAEKIGYYEGDLMEEQDGIVGKLKKLMDNIDEVMSAKKTFFEHSRVE